MILMVDNYDSFTYNLVQYFGDLGSEPVVKRNDEITVQDALDMNPQAIIISPGPATPDQAGVCLDLVKMSAEQNIPLFGVCLGHQTIGQAFGGNIVKAPAPIHGKTSQISHNQSDIFNGLTDPFCVTRYHSLIIEDCPDDLMVTATSTDDQLIMAVQHKTLPIYGVQFHPESIASEFGHKMLENFLNLAHNHNDNRKL